MCISYRDLAIITHHSGSIAKNPDSLKLIFWTVVCLLASLDNKQICSCYLTFGTRLPMWLKIKGNSTAQSWFTVLAITCLVERGHGEKNEQKQKYFPPKSKSIKKIQITPPEISPCVPTICVTPLQFVHQEAGVKRWGSKGVHLRKLSNSVIWTYQIRKFTYLNP